MVKACKKLSRSGRHQRALATVALYGSALSDSGGAARRQTAAENWRGCHFSATFAYDIAAGISICSDGHMYVEIRTWDMPGRSYCKQRGRRTRRKSCKTALAWRFNVAGATLRLSAHP